MDVFATSFLPNTLFLRKWLKAENPIIDIGENYVKQTYRSRCFILSSNGPLMITVPLRKMDSKRVADQVISFTEDWQTKGLRAIRSSYANSPYYEHYQEEFEEFFMSKEPLLHQYNQRLFNWLLRNLYIDREITISEEYIESGWKNDYRVFDFEHRNSAETMPVYKQVFSHKMDFAPGLSAIDLLFNKGPEAFPYLK